MHTSVKLSTPCEFINVTPLNPLISKCQIKVCYVGEEPNRNKSIITKETARQMANSLPGSPIVGFFNEATGDFEEHNRSIDISNGQFKIKDTTKPYGFVDLGAKVWFQKFLDDDSIEHEYLMTEGYLWTGQYPEAKRILEKGNNQSMELDDKLLNANWTKDSNGNPQFFIINEAIVSKLCILGEDFEPCFEGSNITNIQFSFEDNFKQQLFSMMNELKDFLNKGGTQVFTTYAVKVGDSLWSALYSYTHDNYSIISVCEDAGQKYAVLQNKKNENFYTLNFSIEGDLVTFAKEVKAVDYTPAEEPQFALSDIEAFEIEFKKNSEDDQKKKKEDDKSEDQPKDDSAKEDNSTQKKDDSNSSDKEDKGSDNSGNSLNQKKDNSSDNNAEKKDNSDKSKTDNSDNNSEDDSSADNSSKKDDKEDEDKKKKKYSLEEISEYMELKSKYSKLESDYSALVSEIESLKQFKLATERTQKEEMINKTFYMLSEEDKKDVIDNIDKYSLDDIEAKLSIICVRNKVSFAADDNENQTFSGPTTFNLGSNLFQDDSTPAWVKAVLDTAKTLN